MSIYSNLNKHVLFPLADKLNGSTVIKEYKAFKSTDWANEESLFSLQNEKIKALVRHCYDNVPYYTKIFDRLGLKVEDIKTREDLQKIPILTKQIIRDNYDDLISKDAYKRVQFKHSTGGSTGVPLQFQSDKQTWSASWASSFRAWDWYGFHFGEKIFTLGGNSLVKRNGISSKKDIFEKILMRNYKHSSSDVDDNAMQEHYKALMKLKPKAIRGYASSLAIFARYIEKNLLPVPKIKLVLTTGETLLPQYRYILQKVFRAPVYDGYGAGDGGVQAFECYMHQGYHIAEERCVVEITDSEGNVLPDGQPGYVITTDLDNYVFPFLRYQVGDMAYIKKEKCSCGRQSRLLGEILGRAGMLLYNKQGIPISPTMLPMMLYRNNDYHNIENQMIYNKIDKFQIRQDKKGDIEVLLKLKDSREEHKQFDYIIKNFTDHFVGSNVKLSFVDSIPTLPSGKEDYCVSEYDYKGAI